MKLKPELHLYLDKISKFREVRKLQGNDVILHELQDGTGLQIMKLDKLCFSYMKGMNTEE